MEKHINIIALNIPFPANYGGVIDIYYKLYTLSRCGFKIHLHFLEYGVSMLWNDNLCEEAIYSEGKRDSAPLFVASLQIYTAAETSSCSGIYAPNSIPSFRGTS